MRDFVDHRGKHWEAAIGKESYGTLVLLFSAAGSGEIRRLVLEAASRLEAEGELARLNTDDLRSRLRDAEPWR